jgi:hypothetical protein
VSNDVDLVVDFCSYKAAKYAVENWHYSKTMPVGKLVKIGVWENGSFIGVCLFGRGGNNNIGCPYSLSQPEVCELVRVALCNHKTFVTKVISNSLRLLKKKNPCLKLVVSYADTNQNHTGIIYQAGNWIYEGKKQTSPLPIIVNGKAIHCRTLSKKYGTASLEWIRKHVDNNAYIMRDIPKHKYLMPLTKKMRRKIKHLAKPYPKKEQPNEQPT